MFKTLYAKLSLVLLVLLALIGGSYIALTLYSTRVYLREVDQNFNRTLAENLIAGKNLIDEGEVNRLALQEIFHMYMVINPNIEIYLLDNAGTILAFSAPAGKVKRNKVTLAPVRRFLSGAEPLPILGDDPRDASRQKIFSAAPVLANGRIEGYLYVVLAGEKYESVAQLIEGSYMLRLSMWVVAASLLFALIAGLALFSLLTRRLTRLSTAVKAFEEGGLGKIEIVDELGESPQDEIGQLSTTFQHMAERIAQQMRTLQETDSLRRELVANVSHDLRTPIASLHGYLETLLLKEGQLSRDEQRTYLQIALNHSEKLAALVTDLFELARLDSGEIRIHDEPFMLAELVQDVLLKFQLASQRNGVTLDADFPKDLPFVSADIKLIERVLDNLVENALRHTAKGGTVKVLLRPHGEAVTVQVADTGCGIPEVDLNRIFDRFYQAHKGDRSSNDGAGLGLAIAKRILELHGIAIAVDSEVGVGTTFRFALPVSHA
ncbi:MAG: ATP-binding protein [Gammaproteobacteria bacterium]|nr:MAG: ATP-binding protein [Gammaproteobacteria bacterium]